jgi:hypothetical protein
MYRLKLSFFLILVLGISPVFGQVYSDKVVGKKNTELADSIKASEYPYILPILGDAATKRGFNLPYSAGLGLNYIWQESDLIIENLQVGFNHRPMQDLSEVIRFNSAVSKAGGINFRPDVWLFPFLNIYGIVAKVQPSTTVDFGVYVPDGDGNWNNVINMTSKAEFDATSFGFGVTPTLGIGGGWMALDMNFTWNDIAELEKPAFAFIFGPRLGKSFKLKKPEQNIALWVGGFRLKLNTGTSGSLNLTDVIETDGLQARVDAGLQKVSDSYISVESWWNGLSSVEQKNPVNIVKYEGANRALERASGFLNSLDEALNDEQQASVQYSLDKRPKDMWNFVIGTQYQHNKHWMLRAEVGFLGSRTQLITGLQYRFGL